MGELLKVRGLSAGAGEKPILHGIDLTVGEGETHVLWARTARENRRLAR